MKCTRARGWWLRRSASRRRLTSADEPVRLAPCGRPASTTSASRRETWKSRPASTRRSSGWERIPVARLRPARLLWLQVGDVQLHLLLDRGGTRRPPESPSRPDDRRLRGVPTSDPRARVGRLTFGWSLVELPSGQVQLYFRDPGGNLIEWNWPYVETLILLEVPGADAAGRPDPAVGGVGTRRALPLSLL